MNTRFEIPDVHSKLHDLISEFLEVSTEVCEFSKVEMMESLLRIFTAEDIESVGHGDTMREYLAADDRSDDNW